MLFDQIPKLVEWFESNLVVFVPASPFVSTQASPNRGCTSRRSVFRLAPRWNHISSNASLARARCGLRVPKSCIADRNTLGNHLRKVVSIAPKGMGMEISFPPPRFRVDFVLSDQGRQAWDNRANQAARTTECFIVGCVGVKVGSTNDSMQPSSNRRLSKREGTDYSNFDGNRGGTLFPRLSLNLLGTKSAPSFPSTTPDRQSNRRSIGLLPRSRTQSPNQSRLIRKVARDPQREWTPLPHLPVAN